MHEWLMRYTGSPGVHVLQYRDRNNDQDAGGDLARADAGDHPGHRAGRVRPGMRHASRRLGAARLRMTKRTYLPMYPERVTRIVTATPVGRKRSSWRTRPGLSASCCTGHRMLRQLTSTFAVRGAVTFTIAM